MSSTSCVADPTPYDAARLGLTVAYVCFGILCFVYMTMMKWKQNAPLWHNMFHVLLCLGCFARAAHFGTQYIFQKSNIMDDIPHLAAIGTLVNSIPSFIFFSAYLIILLRWAIIYHYAYDMAVITFTRVRILFYFINAVMYITIITLYILDFLMYPPHLTWNCGIDTLIDQVIYGLDALMYLFTSLGFVLYTIRITRKFRYMPSRNNAKQQISVRLQRFTTLVLTVFCVRAFWTLCTNFWIINFNQNYWFVDVLYYVILEILPLTLMFLILRNSSKSGTREAGGPTQTTPLINNSRDMLFMSNS